MYARGGDHPYRAPCRRALERLVHERIPHNLTEILSVDQHFDAVPGVRRIDPMAWTSER